MSTASKRDSRDAKVQVFFSYHRESSALCARLFQNVLHTKYGFGTFLDTDYEGPAALFAEQIDAQIESSHLVVVFLGKDTLAKSEWVHKEIHMALKHGKPMVPVFQEGFSKKNEHSSESHVKQLMEFHGLNVYDIKNDNIEQTIDKLARIAQSTARASQGRSARPAAPEPQESSSSQPASHGLPGKLGHYRIERKLGAGGQAEVYKAFDDRLQRPVALKVLVVDTASVDARERFDREAKATAKLKHPHIVTIFDVGSQDKYLYYAMEVLPGGDLKARVLQGLPHTGIIDILLEICEALAFAHSKGFVHRDLKPENVLFDEHGRAVVTDLGIAKYFDGTKTRGVFGTPYYMSPEQVRGDAVDGRSDLYSLGAMLYWMLTREHLFAGGDSISICSKHLHDQPPPLRAPALAFQPLLDRLLAKDPKQRWPDARAVITQLQLLRSRLGGKRAADGSIPPWIARPTAWRAATVAGVATLSSVALYAAVEFLPQRDTESTRNPAPTEAPLSEKSVPIPGPPVLPSATEPDMVVIPTGTFMMGSAASEPGHDADEAPPHPVTIKEFEIARREVTVGEFRKFVASTNYRTRAETSGCY